MVACMQRSLCSRRQADRSKYACVMIALVRDRVDTLNAWQMEGFPSALSEVRKVFLLTLTLLVRLSLSESDSRGLKPFEDNLYANLLMRAVSGSLYPEETFPGAYVSPDFPKQVTILASGILVI